MFLLMLMFFDNDNSIPMSKLESLLRHCLIIHKIQRCPSTFEEINDFLKRESEVWSQELNISKRTFQRDCNEIRSLYNIDIRFDFSLKVFYLEEDDQRERNERILEAFYTFNALNVADELANHIHFEKRRPQGTENLNGLLHAIKNHFQIRFKYQKYWEDELTHRIAEPLALKEFRNRWYVLATDLKDSKIKSFALDRLTELDITRRLFESPANFDINTYYKYAFGIISPNGMEPQEIILSFDPNEGEYIKSLPLHESQKVIIDNDEELMISLNIVVTHDLLMEILSHGEYVKVIAPENLVRDITTAYKNALNQYENGRRFDEY